MNPTLEEKREIVKQHYEQAYKGLVVDPELPEANVNELYTNIQKLSNSEYNHRDKKRAQTTLSLIR